MHFTPITTKTESLYCACSPELDVVSYGACREEALNNLADEIRLQQGGGLAAEAAATAGYWSGRGRRLA